MLRNIVIKIYIVKVKSNAARSELEISEGKIEYFYQTKIQNGSYRDAALPIVWKGEA